MTTTQYKPSFSLRRAQKDLDACDCVDEYEYNMETDTVSFQYKNKNIFMQLNNFPFRPPNIQINNKPFSYCPIAFPKRLWDRYMTIYPNKCLCCKSIVCANNWSPACRLGHILAEYNEFTDKLKTIAKILVFEHSFLPDDMIREIVSFLI